MLILNQFTVAAVLEGNDVIIIDVLVMTNTLEISPFTDSLQGKSMFCDTRQNSGSGTSKLVHCSAICLSMEDVSTHELNIQPASPTHVHTGMHRKCVQMSICDLRRAHMRNRTLRGDTGSNTR